MLEPETLEVLCSWAEQLLRLHTDAVDAPWTLSKDSSPSRLQVVADEPWRRRPNRWSDDDSWQELADICTLSGGRSDDAEANGQFIAFAREASPQIAMALILICRELYPAKESAEAAAEQRPIPPHPPRGRGSNFYYTALRHAADLIDDFFAHAPSEGWIAEQTDRNLHPAMRLISGDGDSRAARAALLRSIAEVVDPSFDKEKAKTLPASSRVPANTRPTIADFLNHISKATGVLDLRDENEIEREIQDLAMRFHNRKVSNEHESTGSSCG